MPDENRGDAPSGNSDEKPPRQDPRPDLPKQGIVRNNSAAYSSSEEDDSESPSRKVHWINHATFYLSVILAVLTGGTLRVYWLQLQQMIDVTHAARDSAYDACISAKIARQTLLEYQSGEADTHNSASANVAQVAVTTRGETPIISTAFNVSGPLPAGGQVNPFLWDSWKDATFSLNVSNVGRSSATNVRFGYTVQIMPQGAKSALHERKVPFDEVNFGVLPFLSSQQVRLRFIDQNLKPIGKLSEDQRENLRTGKLWAVAFGHVEYNDTFGTPHWQDFCNDFDTTPAYESSAPQGKLLHEECGKYNRMDKNLLYSIPSQTQPVTLPTSLEDIKCTAPKD